jgi:hypothetical protein
MWKMFGWLGRTVAAGLIVSFLAIWTAGYIVNSYVETLLKQYNLPMETQPMALSGVWGTLWGADSPSGQEKDEPSLMTDGQARTGTDTADTTDAAESDAGGTDPVAKDALSISDDPTDAPDDGAGSSSPDAAADGAQTDALGAAGEASEETGSGTGPEAQAGAQREETILTPDELADARDAMTDEDRNKLFAILVSKLPQEEWQTISTYVESGLTESELTNVQQIVAKYLNRAEYDELMEILSKY